MDGSMDRSKDTGEKHERTQGVTPDTTENSKIDQKSTKTEESKQAHANVMALIGCHWVIVKFHWVFFVIFLIPPLYNDRDRLITKETKTLSHLLQMLPEDSKFVAIKF